MPSRFEFERAVRHSGLPPLSRLLALTIATWADVETGVIAKRNQPAQSVLLEATGMSKSSFLTHRKTLLAEGWIKCKSPDPIKAQKEHAQNVYSIQIPEGKAGSGGDLAIPRKSGKSDKARSGGDPARSDMSDSARSGDDLAKTGEVGNAQVRLGREPTTRVLSSSSTPPLPIEGGQAGSEERIPRAFDYCQPLIKAMTDAGLVVSWQMGADDWQAIARVLERAGVEAMVNFALGVKSRERISYARFYLKGWLGLPPKSTKPRANPQQLRTVPEWCKHPDCDEKTRTREVEDDRGIRSLERCPDCNPKAKGHAA